MITTNRYTHYTRSLTAREYRILALHCQSHGYRYTSLKLTHTMVIDDLSITQAKALAKLEDAVTNNTEEKLTNA